jgi:hypothetical protein
LLFLRFTQLQQSELRLDLDNGHCPVELEAAVDATHAAIKELVEVNVAILAPNSHLEHLLLHFRLRYLLRDADGKRELLEELGKHLLLDLNVVLFLSELDPDLFEEN